MGGAWRKPLAGLGASLGEKQPFGCDDAGGWRRDCGAAWAPPKGEKVTQHIVNVAGTKARLGRRFAEECGANIGRGHGRGHGAF